MIHVLTTPEAGVVYTKPWMVAFILDLAGYTPDRDLGRLVAVEPSAGDGAFLQEMVRRLVMACRFHETPLDETHGAIRAFEISPDAIRRAVESVTEMLIGLDVVDSLAASLAQSWIEEADFLEASLGFPIADFVVGNPPYIRLEDIPATKAAFYRSFSAMRGRADIYIAFYQAALLQLKPGGVCVFICADRWMLNDYGSGLREFITTQGYSVRRVIEAHDVAAFESEVSAYPAVTVIAREVQGAVIVAKALPGIETAGPAHLLGLLAQARSGPGLRVARFPDWFHEGEPWPCSSPEMLQLLKHLEATCLPLEDPATGTRIGIGVATGADRVFITDKKLFGDVPRPFVGWLMLVEDAPKSRRPIRDRSVHFPVRPEFQGASYIERYNLLCKKLVQEQLYTTTAVLASPQTAIETGVFSDVSSMTSLKTFVTSFAGHIAAEAAR